MARLNPDLPAEAPEEAYRKRMCTDAPSLMQHIHSLHRMLADGGTMKYRRKGDSIAGAQTKAIDFYEPDTNDWPVVNQFVLADRQHTRRRDAVFICGGSQGWARKAMYPVARYWSTKPRTARRGWMCGWIGKPSG
ncbi:MAG: type I restriction endonuclease [Acidiferrobacter thiooxydans]